MVRIKNSHNKLSLEVIEQFETENSVKLTEKYKGFLLKWNGGTPEPNLFEISEEQGKSVLNVFNGIGDMYDNLEEVIDIYEFRLPDGFIPIADDPAGNAICLATKVPYMDNIYFWNHEQEPENPDDMSNMYFLANDINEFLEKLHDDVEE